MKTKVRQVYINLLVLFWTMSFQNILAQSNYIFHHLGTNDGLSNNNVKAVLKDSYGFLWIGTESGLNRYDGYGFKNYTMQKGISGALQANDIFGLQEDGLGNIWVDIGYNNYMVYKRDKDNFISDTNRLLLSLGIKCDPNGKIFIDKKKDIWVFNKEKVFHYNINKKRTAVYKLKIPVKEIISIADSDEYLYTIANTSGVCWKLNKSSGVVSLIDLPDTVLQNAINAWNKIYLDSSNGIWLYSGKTEKVFYKKNYRENWKILSLSSKLKTETNKVLSIIENQPGEVWIGTDHKGLFIYDKNNDLLKNIISSPWEETSLASNYVQYLYKDNNETMWLGYNKKGLSLYHESFRNFINFKHPECFDISAIMQDSRGNIWLGTDGNGVFVKEKISEAIRKLPIPNVPIVCIVEDIKNRVWIGTFQNGLLCYENGKITQFTTKNSKLSSNNIWSLKKDRYGNIWIGPLGGKIQLIEAESNYLDSLKTPVDNFIYVQDMFYDGGDKIYAATVSGLLEIDIISNKKTLYKGNKKASQHFPLTQIANVYKDKRGIIWLGSNNGLTILDKKKDTLYFFNKEKGLSDNSIKDITEDNFNNIWVTTSNGLSILTVTSEPNGSYTFSSKNFSIKDGLMDNYFNSHAICKLQNGDIIFGNAEGFTFLNPSKMFEKDQPMAKVIFTELTVGSHTIQADSYYDGRKLLEYSMPLTSKLNLRHDDKLISLQFTTGDLLNADKVKYVYKIEGFNDQWTPTQGNKIGISSLPTGNYKLLIKACNSDGVWNDVPTELSIIVMPPFYFSIWAFIIYAILIIGMLVFFVHKTKEKHLIKMEQHRLEVDHEKKIHINEIKLRFFTNISHDLRTPLTLIITPLQILLKEATNESMRKKLDVMYKNAQQLMALINSLLDFHKLDVGVERLNLKSGDFVSFINEIYTSFCVYAEELNVNFFLFNDMESLIMPFDQDKVRKILINILSNAFKYTPNGGVISIHIKQENDTVCVSVSDSGSGIVDKEKEHIFERFYQAQQEQEKTGAGIGLHIVNEYVNLHGGTIEVNDNVPKGSIFTFRIPIKIADSDTEEEYLTENLLSEFAIEELENDGMATNKKILLFVDDNNDFCEFIKDNLKDIYIVITANNGEEALELLNKFNVTIIVSDIMMPVMSGTELCKQVKTNIYWSHIPIILLTARTAEEYIMEGLELGADDYITKPFNFDLLKLRIQKFVEWTERSHVSFSQKLDVSPAEITITPLDEALIGKAIKVVEESINDTEFSVETLSVALGLSRGHLYKKLIAITGKGPNEFIRTIRLKRGRQLLEKSQMKIAEIGYEVGFNSPTRFAKYFREEFGLSPSEYLRIYKQQ
ncbi:two-component regulator propeller domain-containing protein [Flavobacterium piscis]|uniref:histidine kinase n=1 Tax=Flavobacterium piscis TaxID=1114874 RepID=A0ABU1Y7R3_9FLAO|nr:two-component regulator propeller domain-containing protein [Flavobacterium piscis]MDR7210274.1 signal transduction histidine kinase/ligand-binding sensor domain-containing protein/DNA-binding response OmpR family regulator [Flavobacterium piscis]